MQLALGALESDPISHAGLVSRKQAIAALRQALVDADDTSQERVDEKAKREQKPVAWTPQVWRQFRPDGTLEFQKIKRTPNGEWEDYTAPPKRDLTCVCGAVWEGEMMVHPPSRGFGMSNLIQAAQSFVDCWDSGHFFTDRHAERIRALRAAIAKATGEKS